ncbi:formimidoylglutamase [Hahella sp. CCB-MM4]|uniref:formimidoylglutamase n=1 Tax=Hahella sp. (strain CCB-MM4) TaxID=1926491 RepID=UPI000B9B1FFB|nr:formimidoylglutamase [Hahella sp. CCB-MM4]OZG71360.1 formimidoylglutamase [Hahella sp. CCB-MM4]
MTFNPASSEGFNQKLWQGRVDTADGKNARRWHQMVQAMPSDAEPAVAIVGYPCDLGVAANQGRIGAAEGPNQIRQALAKLPWHHTGKIYDSGNVKVQPTLESTQALLADQVAYILQQKCAPLVLGGGHDIAWGSFQGLRTFLLEQSKRTSAPLPKVGILNFDAHFDLRSDSEGASSGTPFFQVARDCAEHGLEFHYAAVGISRHSNTQTLFDRAEEWRVTWIADTEAGMHQIASAADRLAGFLQQIDALYITIDMDAFPAAVAPGVSAPAPRGISVELVETLLEQIEASRIPVLLAEIAEFNPTFDIDGHTARLAARLAATLAGMLENSRVYGSVTTDDITDTATTHNNIESTSLSNHD